MASLTKPCFGALLLLSFAASPAVADEKIDCTNPMVQFEMNVCANRAYDAADKKLNDTYRKLMSKLDPAAQQNLKAAERKWIGFRDTQCKEEAAGDEGGSIYPMTLADCMTEKTNARIEVLNKQLR